jgi:hypothetical protein
MPDSFPDDLNPSDHRVLAENIRQKGFLGYALRILRNPASGFDVWDSRSFSSGDINGNRALENQVSRLAVLHRFNVGTDEEIHMPAHSVLHVRCHDEEIAARRLRRPA